MKIFRNVPVKRNFLPVKKTKKIQKVGVKNKIMSVKNLNEMIAVLSDPRYGSNLLQVSASVKKHEAISADILARSDR